MRPYVELLAGATRWRIRERFLDRTGWQAATDFSLQPGVGVDVFFTRRAALRLGADLRVLFKHDNRFDTDYRTNLYRLHAASRSISGDDERRSGGMIAPYAQRPPGFRIGRQHDLGL